MSDGRDLTLLHGIIAASETEGESITLSENDIYVVKLMRSASLQAIVDELRSGDMTAVAAAHASIHVNRLCTLLLSMEGRRFTEVPF